MLNKMQLLYAVKIFFKKRRKEVCWSNNCIKHSNDSYRLLGTTTIRGSNDYLRKPLMTAIRTHTIHDAPLTGNTVVNDGPAEIFFTVYGLAGNVVLKRVILAKRIHLFNESSSPYSPQIFLCRFIIEKAKVNYLGGNPNVQVSTCGYKKHKALLLSELYWILLDRKNDAVS